MGRDKKKDFKFDGFLNFIEPTAIAEETRIEVNDTGGITVRLKNTSNATNIPTLVVNTFRATNPPGGTINVFGGQTEFGPVGPGETAEGEWLVKAGTNPTPYAINVRVIAFGQINNPDFDQTFTLDMPDQAP